MLVFINFKYTCWLYSSLVLTQYLPTSVHLFLLWEPVYNSLTSYECNVCGDLFINSIPNQFGLQCSCTLPPLTCSRRPSCRTHLSDTWCQSIKIDVTYKSTRCHLCLGSILGNTTQVKYFRQRFLTLCFHICGVYKLVTNIVIVSVPLVYNIMMFERNTIYKQFVQIFQAMYMLRRNRS